jgi:membrane associated rhomboid family serine protease
MGIQDRDYYRNEGPSIFDSLMPRGLMCRWLIGINVVMFILQIVAQTAARPTVDPGGFRFDERGQAVQVRPHIQESPGVVTEWLILDVNEVRHGQVWRLLTYAFLHDMKFPFLHLIFNMLFLWWFGSDVEQLYGSKEFLAIYLVSAFLGGVAYEIWGLTQLVAVPCLGASGAVTTMLILCALHFPRRVIYMFAILPMPIWLFAVFNVLMDVAGFLGVGDRSVAFCVHLAGAGFAVAYYKWQGSIVGTLSEFMWWKKPRARVRLKLFNPDPEREEAVAVSANSAPQAAADEYLEAKLDAVLEKIARSGKESLTNQEQEILRKAAEMYKRRRS